MKRSNSLRSASGKFRDENENMKGKLSDLASASFSFICRHRGVASGKGFTLSNRIVTGTVVCLAAHYSPTDATDSAESI